MIGRVSVVERIKGPQKKHYLFVLLLFVFYGMGVVHAQFLVFWGARRHSSLWKNKLKYLLDRIGVRNGEKGPQKT